MLLNTKYTLILSAFKGASNEVDYIANAKLAHWLQHVAHVNVTQCVGVYKGGAELSYVVHTNSAQTRRLITDYALHELEQDSILVSHNRLRDIVLYYAKKEAQHIGTAFRANRKQPKANDYTYLDGMYYTVEY